MGYYSVLPIEVRQYCPCNGIHDSSGEWVTLSRRRDVPKRAAPVARTIAGVEGYRYVCAVSIVIY